MLLQAIQEYIKGMLSRVSGMKVLILDSETTGMVSLVQSQSEILEHEVFLVERIETENRETMRHLNAILFLRHTDKNFMLLTRELTQPRYAEYHIFFSNIVPHHRLEQLACRDEFEVVHQVHEYFCDLFMINHNLFSLGLPSTVGLTSDASTWSTYEEAIFNRHVDGLFATVLALKRHPIIRFAVGSELNRKIAHGLQQKIITDNLIEKAESECLVLICDRRDDPVTPLLNQWTYQAMVHELLNLENNRVDMKNTPNVRVEQKEIVLSAHSDQFFETNLLSNFGDLGVAIKEYVESYQEQTKNTANIESIEAMQRFVDEYPEFRKLSGNVSKHVAVVHELSRLVDSGNLLDISQLEQEIACQDSRTSHYQQVMEKINANNVSNMEKLRLVLLYSLRYEHDASVQTLKTELRKYMGEDQVSLINCLLRYAGSHVRSGDLFSNKSFLAAATNKLQKGFKGVQNVYTQHKSNLKTIVNQLLQGTLKESAYPYAQPGRGTSNNKMDIIIFMVGGVTFEEARDMMELVVEKQNQCRIILGGSTIHNSRSFLADVALLARAGAD